MKMCTRQLTGILQKDHCPKIQKACGYIFLKKREREKEKEKDKKRKKKEMKE